MTSLAEVYTIQMLKQSREANKLTAKEDLPRNSLLHLFYQQIKVLIHFCLYELLHWYSIVAM
jgi:hypothetical protein